MTPEQAEVEARRSAQVDRLLAQMSSEGPMILDVRSQRLLVEHVRALEGHVGELAQACLDAEAKAGTDDRTIARLLKDLEDLRAEVARLELATKRHQAEVDKLQADERGLRVLVDAAQMKEHLDCTEIARLHDECAKLRAERDAALARLSEPRGCQERGVVIELGVRIL